MTVAQEIPVSSYLGNGSTTIFNVGFYVRVANELTVQVNGVDATVGSWSYSGGSVTFLVAPAVGVKIVFARKTPLLRTESYVNYSNRLRADVIDADFDRLWLVAQEIGEKLGRALIVPNGTNATAVMAQVLQLLVDFPAEVAARIAGDDALRAYVNTLAFGTGLLTDNLISVLQPFAGAITRTQHDKNAESVSVMDFGAIGDNVAHTVQEWYTVGATYYRGYANLAAVQAQYPHVTGASYLVDQAAIEAASIALAAVGGGTLIFPRGKYFYRRLTIRSGVIWRGAGSQCTMLTCVDNTTLDSGVTFGSSIRKPDDGTRAFRAGFYGLSFWTGAAGTGSNQATYQNVAAINLCACERTTFDDVGFGGFGYGALILARAEAGAEGLGFVNTTHDGNYNTFFNLSFGSCGRFNPDKAVIWLKYKANSNKVYAAFAKGCTDAYLMVIPHGNDNAIFGGTLESCAGVANIGSGTIAATGNYISGVRVEGASMDAYLFGALAENNFILGGYHTGVVGQDFNMINKNNRILSDATNHLRSKTFPPTTNYSTLNQQAVMLVTAINGDVNYPLYIKAEVSNDPLIYPVIQLYNDVVALAAGNVLGSLEFSNRDTTAGAAGVSAAIEAVIEDSAGATGLSFLTGTGTTLSEKLRIRSNGAQDFVVPTATLALTKNGTMNFRLASDTSLEIRVRGSDGVTRKATLTLA